MDAHLENRGGLRRRLTARIPGQQLESLARARLRELAGTVSIKGFRPGKIPASVIERRFGQQVRNEALAAAVNDSWQAALLRSGLRPVLRPSVTARPVDGGDIEFTADFEVLPEPGLIDVSALELTKCTARVEETDVDRAMDAKRQHDDPGHGPESATAADDGDLLEHVGFREGGMERARADVRCRLERELGSALAARNKADALRQLLAAYADLDVPDGLVEVERNARLAQSRRRSADSKPLPPSGASDFTEDARARVRAFILLTEIARQNSIVPEQARVNAALAEIAASYEDPERVVEHYVQDTELMAGLRNQVIEAQVIEWIVANARVTERTLTFGEVMQASG